MALELHEEKGGKILEVHASGKLTEQDYAHFLPEVERLIRQHGKLRMLFDMHGLRMVGNGERCGKTSNLA